MADPVEDLDRRLYHGFPHPPELGGEACKEAVDNGLENFLHHGVLGHGDAELAKVADKTWRDFLPPPARGGAGGSEGEVLDVLPEELLAVVESLEVHELPEELHRGLGSVLLAGWHVHVVHEHHKLLPRGRPEFGLALFLQLGLNQQLSV